MHMTHNGIQAANATCPQQDQVGAPVEYMQDSQAPTVAATSEQIAVCEAQSRNGPIPWAKKEPANTDLGAVATQTAGISQDIAERLNEVEATLAPMSTGELKERHCTNELEMSRTIPALDNPAASTKGDASRSVLDEGGNYEFAYPVKCAPPVEPGRRSCVKSPAGPPLPKTRPDAVPKRTLPVNTLAPPPHAAKQQTEPPVPPVVAAEVSGRRTETSPTLRP